MKKTAIMNTLKKKIREHKYKFTNQRQIILQAFLDSRVSDWPRFTGLWNFSRSWNS